MNRKRTVLWGLTLFTLLLAGLGARASLIGAELCPVQIKGRIQFDNANPEIVWLCMNTCRILKPGTNCARRSLHRANRPCFRDSKHGVVRDFGGDLAVLDVKCRGYLHREAVGVMEDQIRRTKELVFAAQAGDRAAMDDLFARYLPRVRRITALRIGRRERDCENLEDALQEGLLAGFRQIHRFEWRTEGSFLDWLARCVENKWRDELRRNRTERRGGGRVLCWTELRDSAISESVFAGDGPTPSDVVQARELDEAVERALLVLTPRYREIIVLRQLCGLDYEEIGERMNCTAGSVKTAFCRALGKVRELLPDHYFSDAGQGCATGVPPPNGEPT